MPERVRALIFVLVFAVPAFYIAQRIASSLISKREFAFWRNTWFVVTVSAFLAGNFFVHIAVLAGVCIYAISNRIASVGLFFILLFAVPMGSLAIGGAGLVNKVIELNNARLLAAFLLLPILIKSHGFERRQIGVYRITDWLVIGYVLVQTVLVLRNAEFTSVMRAGTIYALDVLIPYLAFSRMVTSAEDFRKVFLAFVIAILPIALIAVFETVRNWHLYAALSANWGVYQGYLRRGGLLRASSSAFGSISLGFVIMVGIGCALGIWQSIRSDQFKKITLIILGFGILATLSRGPWVGCAILVLVYVATGGVTNLAKFAVVGVVVLSAFLAIPQSSRLVSFLPFVGTVDVGSVTYRQKLFDNSMVVIERYPVFGTPEYRKEPEMIEMLQSEGLIDIVNTFLEIGMKSGLVGLGLFVSIFATVVIGLRRVLKFRVIREASFNDCVRASIAVVIATMVTIATVSSIDFIGYVYWAFAGLCVSLIRIGYKERSAVRVAAPSRVPV